LILLHILVISFVRLGLDLFRLCIMLYFLFMKLGSADVRMRCCGDHHWCTW